MVDKSELAIATSQAQNPIPFLIEFRTYAGTLYIGYCRHEILHTIISFFQIDITFNIYPKITNLSN